MTYVADPQDPNRPLDSNLAATAAPELRALKLRVNELDQTLTNALNQLGSDFTGHENNFNNPHAVTKSQVGLGNVDNKASTNDAIGTGSTSLVTTQQATSNLNTALSNAITTVDNKANTNATAITGLDTRVTANEGDIGQLETDLGLTNGQVLTNANNIISLDGRVTTNEGAITTLQGDVGALGPQVASNTANKLDKAIFDAKWKTDSSSTDVGLDFASHYQYNFGGVHPTQNVQNRSRDYDGNEVLLDMYCVAALASGIRVGNRWHGTIRFELRNDVTISDTSTPEIGGRIRWDSLPVAAGSPIVTDGDTDAMFLKVVNVNDTARPYVAGSFTRGTSSTAGYRFNRNFSYSTIIRPYVGDDQYFEFYSKVGMFFNGGLPAGARTVCYVPVVLVLQTKA